MKKQYNKPTIKRNEEIALDWKCPHCGKPAPTYKKWEKTYEGLYEIFTLGKDRIEKTIVCEKCHGKIDTSAPNFIGDRRIRLFTYEFPSDIEAAEKEEKQFQERLKSMEWSQEFVGIQKEDYGERVFNEKLLIIDPCYDGLYDGKKLKIAKGTYSCLMWNINYHITTNEERYSSYNTSDIGRAGIYLNGKVPGVEKMTRVKNLPVDSGNLGFFNHDNLVELNNWYKNEKWENLNEFKDGILFPLGDGGHPIYVGVENGEITAVEVRYEVYDKVCEGDTKYGTDSMWKR